MKKDDEINNLEYAKEIGKIEGLIEVIATGYPLGISIDELAQMTKLSTKEVNEILTKANTFSKQFIDFFFHKLS